MGDAEELLCDLAGATDLEHPDRPTGKTVGRVLDVVGLGDGFGHELTRQAPDLPPLRAQVQQEHRCVFDVTWLHSCVLFLTFVNRLRERAVGSTQKRLCVGLIAKFGLGDLV